MENIMVRMETRPTRRGFCRAGFISRQEKRTQHYEKKDTFDSAQATFS